MTRKQLLPRAAGGSPAKDNPVRSRIVGDAGRRFFASGFRHVTMDDLAAELGMSKKTLYAHFDTKVQLLEAVIENKAGRFREDLTGVLTARRDFPETLRAFLDCFRRHTSEIQPAFVRDMRLEGSEIFQKVERVRRANIQHCFGELIRAGRRTGYVRKDVPARVIIEILLASVQAIVNPARLEELGLTPRTGCALITKIVLEGAIDPASRSRLIETTGL